MPYSFDFEKGGWFRVTGVYRVPKKGEVYWSFIFGGFAFIASSERETGLSPRVILERVK
jgi:hypothetical protein